MDLNNVMSGTNERCKLRICVGTPNQEFDLVAQVMVIRTQCLSLQI